MTRGRLSLPGRGFFAGMCAGSALCAAGVVGVVQWRAHQPFAPEFGAFVQEERPAQRAARLLEQTAFNLEAMFHRELTVADTPALLNGALAAIDPHGGYIAPEYMRTLSGEGSQEAPYRVGVLGTPLEDRFVVETTAPGGPADMAGLRPGDRVVGVAGMDLAKASGQEVFDALLAAVEKSEGDVVELRVLRGMETLSLSLTPARLAPFFAFDLGTKEGVAHVAVTAFYPGAAHSVHDIVERAVAQGAKGVVLDLRGNGGGRVDETLEMLGLFAPKGTLAYMRDARGQMVEESRTRATPDFPDLRLAVLIDRDSASASEILAAAIQAHGRGLVVGERSYGKGSIQTVYPLDAAGGAIKMTIGFYRDPLGRPIDGIGVAPDKEAPVEGPGPRPLYGAPDAGFSVAAEWIGSGAPLPHAEIARPNLALAPRAAPL